MKKPTTITRTVVVGWPRGQVNLSSDDGGRKSSTGGGGVW